jgi:hypothetical protein
MVPPSAPLAKPASVRAGEKSLEVVQRMEIPMALFFTFLPNGDLSSHFQLVGG